MSTTRGEVIKNGYCKSNTGFRQVLTDNNCIVRPVLFTVDSGYQPDRGTVQVPAAPGDLLFKCQWGSQHEDYFIYEFLNGAWTLMSRVALTVNLWKKLKELNPWTDMFIAPSNRNSSYIVCDEPLAMKAKRKRLTSFFKNWKIVGNIAVVDDYMTSPKNGLNLEVVKPYEGLLDHVPEWTTHIGSVVGIDKKEHWFQVINGVTSLVGCIYQEKHESNYAHENDSYFDGKPLSEVVYAQASHLIKIVIGAYTKDHYSHGRTIDVYKL